MSTIQRINFELVTDILPVQRRDFPLADPTLCDPQNAAVLIDGEWLTLDTNYKILRATDITDANAVAAKRSFPLFAERGRSDVQALSGKKMPILFLGVYEANTRIFSAAANGGHWVAITAVLQPLKIATITIGTRNFSGLVGHAGSSDTDPVVGYVTRLPANNSGQLRFMTGYRS